MISIDDSHAAASGVNAANAVRARGPEAAADFIAAIVLAILGLAGLLHWFEPCADASLCAVGALRVSPRAAWRRIVLEINRRMLQLRIRYAEEDVAWMAHEVQVMPLQLEVFRAALEVLRVQLIDIDTQIRGEA